MALALVQKPEGFSGWWGNVAGRPQEAGLSLEAEFPSLITHPPEQQDQAAFLCLFLDRASWQGGRRLRVFVSYLLEHLCYPAHVWLWLTDQQWCRQSSVKSGRRVIGEMAEVVSMSWALKVEAEAWKEQ